MADLDDFFAKKDKKKGKAKKYVSPDILVKKLEESLVKEKEKSKPSKIEEEGQIITENPDEDQEWNDYAEERKIDLSNLKLGMLTEEKERRKEHDSENENNFDGESGDGANSENPWSKQNAEAQPTKKPEPAPSKPSVFVPSMMRDAARARGKKTAPDLTNTNFPELGAEKPAEPVKTKRDGFEEVLKGAHRSQLNTSAAAVSTGNQYSSLFNDQADS